MKLTLNFLLVVFLFWSCSKSSNPPQLPPATHTGANILACKINGKIFIASGKPDGILNNFGVLFTGPAVAPVSDIGLTYVSGNSESPRYQIDMGFKYTSDGDTSVMAGTYPFEAIFFDYSGGTASTGGNQFETDSAHRGSITVTYYGGNIMAGTFAFDGVNDLGVVVHVTEGRFDIGK